ncbi:MAG: dephospho-CoA kinase [Dehalococcoidales bacterium]
MKIIGLAGGIGSGKSTAARLLAELGAVVIDLDKTGNEALKKGGGAYQNAVREFGEGIVGENGEINRAKLSEIVFNDREALKRLNKIMHPEIDKTVDKKIREYRRQGVKVLVLEAAVMLEAARAWQADEIWVTVANEKTVLERLKARSGYSEEDVKARIRSQITNEQRIKQADVVINNDGTLDELKAKVKAEWERLLKRL